MHQRNHRVLVVGRSAPVLVDVVAMLRDRGYGANASNQFDSLLDDYDVREVDLVIFGGMVPPEKKEDLSASILELNPRAGFLQGLGGIAPLLVAQVEEFFGGAAPGVEYDAATRLVRVTLAEAAPVLIEGLWAAFVPEPVAQSVVTFDAMLEPGVHEIPIPSAVPLEGSYLAVRVGEGVSALRIGEPSQSVQRIVAARALPAPAPVTTRFPWDGDVGARPVAG
ncbi:MULTISPECIES: hypothetical protein [Nocardioides]|uniref:Uncharacterized protein n=1 Tax=Nocardioides vastitatis TaxID=2568655 RepID=A0ABW0ZBZ5_9ACTN|nr:hypothetical protein [Nocardioides sp.]THJ08636.1 hypothetical protein E7Z54_04175 [Nocardioides sp.]